MPTATETDRAREMRLRRAASRKGLVLRKARHGGQAWSLANRQTGEYVFGGIVAGGKSVDQIERFLDNWSP